jgi:histidine triad (HIT) family protein
MATLFTRIIAGELPGRFVWSDPLVVGFLTIAPLRPGHTLVVPRAEVDHWIDLPTDLAAHVMTVSRSIGGALQRAYAPRKVGFMIAGIEVPHCHIHLVPIRDLRDMDFARQDHGATAADLDASAELIRTTLREMGHKEAASKP